MKHSMQTNDQHIIIILQKNLIIMKTIITENMIIILVTLIWKMV